MQLSKQEKTKRDKMIEAAYCRRCKGVQIGIMDISKVFKEGHKALAEGCGPIELEERIVAFVETIRAN